MKKPFGSDVLEGAVRLFVPFVFMFAAYVVLHGHYSPGGGFQGGVIFAVAFILLRLLWGDHRFFGPGERGTILLACLGLFLFAGVGVVSFFFGRNFLDYGDIQHRLTLSLLAEIGIALSVTGVLLLIYDSLVEGSAK